MADEVDAILKHVLEQPKPKIAPADKHIFTMATNDYKSCMDEATIQNLGLSPLRKIVEDMKADLPATKAFSPSRDYRLQFSTAAGESRGDFLTDIMVDAIQLGAPALVAFHIGVCLPTLLISSRLTDL